MRITKLRLQNFKRFTDLTIEDVPATAKLVLLIGSNGSGKSSVFDGFEYLEKLFNRIIEDQLKVEYYPKNNLQSNIFIEFDDRNHIDVQGGGYLGSSLTTRASKFYGRSSIRIVPRVSNDGDPKRIAFNGDSPSSFIDTDSRFMNDLFMYMQEIDNALREPIFKGQSADTLKIFQDSIQPLNTSLINIFGGDGTTTIQLAEYENASPRSNGRLVFTKGNSKINYDLLSHGEKQVVILLLNFIVRKEYYEDALIYIDEMDCHLNTALQSRLLEEIVTRWIPDTAQLWTATHALGFIDYAQRSEQAAIIDLDLLNFDIPQTILPQPKERMDVYDIAIPKDIIQHILKGHKLVAVENKNDQYFNLALGEKGFLFLPASNNREVFLTAKGDNKMLGLRDKDYLRPDEVKNIIQKFPNLRILEYYAFENYIYHPDNIAELKWNGYSKDEYIQSIIKEKNEKLLNIVDEIGGARQTYIEFKEGIKDDGKRDEIINALKSNDFETFYPYFNMKKHYDKKYLQKIQHYDIKDLVQTQWFKQQIEKILNS